MPIEGTTWTRCTTDPSLVPATQSGFPVLVTAARMPASFATELSGGGGGVRAYSDEFGTVRYSADVVLTPAGAANQVWVLVPVVSGAVGSDFVVSWGGGGSQPAPGDTYGRNAVHVGRDAVFHFEEDPSDVAPQLIDSTGNGYDGTSVGGMTSGDLVSGIVGNAWDFDGSGDKATSTYQPVAVTKFTASSWADHDAVTPNDALWGFLSGTGFYLMTFGVGADWLIGWTGSGFARALGAAALGPQQLVVTYDADGASNADRLKIYVNAVPQVLTFTGGLSGPITFGTPLTIAGISGFTLPWDGLIDETSFTAQSAMDADAVVANYNNQSNDLFFSNDGEHGGIPVASDATHNYYYYAT